MTIQFEISEYLYKCLKKRIELNAASELDMLVDKGTVVEQEPILDKIRAEIEELYSYVEFDEDLKTSFNMIRLEDVQKVLDKYKAESENT